MDSSDSAPLLPPAHDQPAGMSSSSSTSSLLSTAAAPPAYQPVPAPAFSSAGGSNTAPGADKAGLASATNDPNYPPPSSTSGYPPATFGGYPPAPSGSHNLPSYGSTQGSSSGGLPYPPAGGSQYPPAGGPQYPPAGGPQYPPAGGPQYPPAGGPQYPPAGGPQYPPAGGPEQPSTIVVTDPAMFGVEYSTKLNRHIWVPEKVPHLNLSSYLPYFQDPIPVPAAMGPVRRYATIYITISLITGSVILVLGLIQDPIGLEAVIFGSCSLFICLILALVFFMKKRKAEALLREQVSFQAQALEFISSGRPPPIPRVAVCKYCQPMKVNRHSSIAICSKPLHMLVPPYLACVDNLGPIYNCLVMDLLRKL
ncbi:hypothetical protein H696_03210 [Fonticula alba]|uniref:Uncharacterized protein n=1 Tax=Fonticula alba TaxID=691883 RepID=A0A058ZA77_FONAL|nr:hypothetical protein H696_03210 [Fonticula alba]KCV70853.1 hypothetical protein H696_03210 [Fonticula alba]|eukprot:XP_009495369.1 hypothetical protein H696_03210 [Fonticula alba]